MDRRWWCAAGLAAATLAAGINRVLASHESTLTAAVVFVAGLIGLSIAFIHRWLHQATTKFCTTDYEKEYLRRATEEQQAEKAKFIAARGALGGERARLLRDIDDRRRRIESELAEKKAALDREFEESRAQLVCQGFADGVLAERSGQLSPQPVTPEAALIHLDSHRRHRPGDPHGTGTGGTQTRP